MRRIAVICIDVGSIQRGRFAWAKGIISPDGLVSVIRSKDIFDLVELVASELRQGFQVALGFECPLFVPITDEPENLTKARNGEGNRPWSAGAGCGVLATGLTQTVWVLDRLLQSLDSIPPMFLDWSAFQNAKEGLFLWEAFVSGEAKGDDDLDDAEKAIRCFAEAFPNLDAANAVTEPKVYSLIGAALLRTGWSKDLALLTEPCLVIKA